MSKEFLSPPNTFKPDSHPVTPFMKARQAWDDRIGTSVVQAKNWRIAFFSSSMISILSLGLLAQQAGQRKVIPVIVGLDRARGEPVVIGPADEKGYQPQTQEIKYFLANFISLVRSVPSDPVLIKQNWLKGYQFLKPKAANALNEQANQDEKSPLKRIGQETLIVQPLSIIQVAGSRSYQARWNETVYNAQGVVTERYVMNGVFTLEIESPRDEKALSINPLGIFISNFQWNREL